MNKMKGKVAFLTLGCEVNTYETNAMQLLFSNAGYQMVEFSKKADIYVINTCSVTNMADRKSRQMLHKAKKNNPDAIIVAAGCYVQAAKDLLEQDTSIDVVIGNNQKHLIVEIIEKYQENHSLRSSIIDVSQNPDYERLFIQDAGDRTRACIKIQDGCNMFCSYCIIPYTRGRVRSRSEEDIIKEIEELVKNGYKEFVLNGIHLSSYGLDEQNRDFISLQGKPLLSIIKKINNISGVERIRLGSLEPRIITEPFLQELVTNEKVCPHFHLSLQSGCDATLKRMNRKYSTEEYETGCTLIRKYYDNPAITTDVIVGFPGEIEEEFELTKKFAETIAFAQMHIFKFSVRKGTRAEQMDDKVSEQVKTLRSNELMTISSNLQTMYENSFMNKQEHILFEEVVTIDNENYLVGHNERYIKIAVPAFKNCEKLLNTITPVLVQDRLKENLLLGKISS